MKVLKNIILQGFFFLLVMGYLVASLKPESYVKTKALGIALIHSDDMWQEYTLLKYEIFCQGSDGSLLVKDVDPRKLFRFKEVALASQDAELVLPFSEAKKLYDIEIHLKAFDGETTYSLTSLDTDYQEFKQKQECYPITQKPKPLNNSTAGIARSESHLIAKG